MELNYQGKKFDGNIIWNRYISLLNNTAFSYTKKQIELSKINRELSYFTFSVGVEPLTYSDIIGDLYLLEDGVKYIEEGKFNRKLYNEINLGKKTDYDQMIM